MKMHKLSVVIPTYNNEGSIGICLQSVSNQTKEDIQIIVIDDGSTDKTLDIINQLAMEDKRIHIIKHDKNLSASIARKNGILASNSSFIMFLDADDQYYKNTCEVAIRGIEAEQVDIMQFKTTVINYDSTPDYVSWFNQFVNKRPESRINGNLVERCFTHNLFGFTLWNKIYKANPVKLAVRKLPDEPIYKAQDLLLSFLIMMHSQSYSSSDYKLYKYYYGKGLTGKKNVTKDLLDIHLCQIQVLEILSLIIEREGLNEKYQKSLNKVAQILIEDNLATIKGIDEINLKLYAKHKFLYEISRITISDNLQKDTRLVKIINSQLLNSLLDNI